MVKTASKNPEKNVPNAVAGSANVFITDNVGLTEDNQIVAAQGQFGGEVQSEIAKGISEEAAIGNVIMQEERKKRASLTSQPARQDLQQQKQDFQQMTTGINRADYIDEQSYQNALARSQGRPEPFASYAERTTKKPVEKPVEGEVVDYTVPATQAVDEEIDIINSTYNSYLSGLDAFEQQQIQDIQREYAGLRREMQRTNEIMQETTKLAGARTSRQRYAPEIQSGILQAEINAGQQRISNLIQEEKSLINQAKQAMQEKRWDVFRDRLSMVRSARQEKSQAIQQHKDNILRQAQEERNKMEFIMNQENFNQKMRDIAKKNLFESIEYGLDVDGLTEDEVMEIETKTGLTVDLIKNIKEANEVAKQVKSQQDQIAFAKDVIGLLDEIPYGETITINGVDYTSSKTEDPLVDTFQETVTNSDGSKSSVLVTLDKRTGERSVLEILNLGKDPESLFGDGLPTEVIKQVDALAKSFDSSPIVKEFIQVQNKKQSVEKIIDIGVGGPGDLALVFEFMKALDPSSVVREAEYDNAAASGNIFKGVMAKFNGYLKESGGFLPDNVKESFKTIVNQKYNVITSQYDNLYNETARKINRKTKRNDGGDFLTQYKYDDIGQTNISNEDLPTLTQSYSTLDDLVYDHPEYLSLITKIENENPNKYSDDEILQYIESRTTGFNQDLSMSQNGSEVDKIASAIGQFESGGNYSARGPVVPTGRYAGERAMGKYQIMPGNLPQWSREALGYEVTEEEFMASPELQDKIAKHQFEKNYNSYGNVEDVASIWFTGQPLAKGRGRKDVLGTSGQQYAQNVRAIYDKLS